MVVLLAVSARAPGGHCGAGLSG